MQVLIPKIYKSNGLEAYRLLGADGSEFFYEGRIDYNEGQVFKDSLGRAYYLVTTDLGRNISFYVEVEPTGKPIPMMSKEPAAERDISDLVLASPREQVKVPKEAFSKPVQEKSKVEQPPEVPENAQGFPTAKPVSVPANGIASTEEEDKSGMPPSEERHEHAIEAMGSIKPRRKSFLKTTLIVAAIAIILLAIAGGIYVYRPDLVRNYVPFLSTPTPEPTLTPTPTPEPTATPTPIPTPVEQQGSTLYDNLYAIGAAINAGNKTMVSQFAHDHMKEGYGNENNMTHTLDVFDYVNAHWTNAIGNNTSANASDILATLTGNDRDYSVAMCAVAESLGVPARVVEAFHGDNVTYYPEILVASNDSDYNDVKMYIGSRYGSKDAYGHVHGTEYWLSLAKGSVPGLKIEADDEYAVDSTASVTRL